MFSNYKQEVKEKYGDSSRGRPSPRQTPRMSSNLEEEKNQAHAIIKINPKNISRSGTGNKHGDP